MPVIENGYVYTYTVLVNFKLLKTLSLKVKNLNFQLEVISQEFRNNMQKCFDKRRIYIYICAFYKKVYMFLEIFQVS